MAATAPVRKKKRHFRNEAATPPFDVECEKKQVVDDDGNVTYRDLADGETPDVITLQDINKMASHTAYEFVRISQSDPERGLRMLVGEDQWTRFWVHEGWMNEPFEATNTLQQEAMEHYTGMTVGNS